MSATNADSDSPTRSLRQKEIASWFGMTAKQIRNLENAGVLRPVVEDGAKRYPMPESLQRYVAFKVQSARGDSVTRERKAVDLRSAQMDADLKAMALAERQGTMISIDDVEKMVEQPLRIVATMLKNLPARWGPELVGCTSIQEAIARLRPAVSELLQELHGAADQLGQGETELPPQVG